jgi:hypothetical protein
MRYSFTQQDVGRVVLARRGAGTPAVRAVVLEVRETPSGIGIACIARLRKDGTIRMEKIWTALWFDVNPE